MVLPGTDGPVITGLEHVTAHSFGCCFPSLERQRLVQAEARAAQIVMFAHYSSKSYIYRPLCLVL